MKSGKRDLTHGMELPIRTRLERSERTKPINTWASWRLTPSNKRRWKKKLRKNISGELSSRNLIKGINTWTVPHIRYSGPFLKWTREELKQMDQKTRKLMTMHKALHPRDDDERLYLWRLTSIEDSVDASIQLEDYIKYGTGRWQLYQLWLMLSVQ